ncbi:MAG: sigma-70 family RNA polymerase sigma factor [Bacteroidales bacterium]|nr:sigma-70 family RNA polymerase sigma factor [Bacteroidales bacterium]
MLFTKTKYRDIHHQLIAACKKGEQKAQMEIYQLYYKAMYNSALRILKNQADAEDVMQDSFLNAFTRIQLYREEGSFGGWLKRIVINNAMDFIRKQKPTNELDESQILLTDEEGDYIENDCRLEDIKEAMKIIKQEYRIIISLYLFEGYDHEEIATIQNITYGLSRTRYSRARQSLLKAIQKVQTEREMKWA